MKKKPINYLRFDPSRTGLLRRKFFAEMKKRFYAIAKMIEELFVKTDVFGVDSGKPYMLTEPKTTMNIERQAWRFRTDPQKVEAFRAWLQEKVDAGLFSVSGGTKPGAWARGTPKAWMAKYIESSYEKGLLRAYIDSNKADLLEKPDFMRGTKEQFLRSAFLKPETTAKVEMLYKRAFNELKGVTDTMGQQMSRVLADGLVAGDNPVTIARDMRKVVDGLTRTRARTIARTEIIRAHSEAQLDAFESLGIEEVGAEVEFITAMHGESKEAQLEGLVCPDCVRYDGEVMSIDKARGLIPFHPNCRCSWSPISK